MKKFSSIMVILVLMTFVFAINAGNTMALGIQKEAVMARSGEYIQNYDEILKELSAEIKPKTQQAMDDDFFELEGSMGIMEVSKYGNPDKLGYAIQDINADGISELIIGEIEVKNDNACFGSKVYAVYTQADGKIYCALEGYDRNRYDILNDGTFFNLGSEGATHTIFGAYVLNPSAKEIVCADFYFSYEKDETCQEIFYYHNTTGAFDKAVSEIISETSFDKMLNTYNGQIKQMQFTPLREFKSM